MTVYRALACVLLAMWCERGALAQDLGAGWQQPHSSLFFPDQQYYRAAGDEDPAYKEKPQECSVQHDKAGFDLAFVEFDQRGDFWDRDQLGVARSELRRRMRGKPLLIEYVHGWHNNGQDDHDGDVTHDRDVERFRNFLGRLAQSSFIREQGYQVFGVYIAWRGEQYRPVDGNPLTQILVLPHLYSFYAEKRIGTQVGSMPMISEALFWMVHEARMASPRASKVVLMGHSFGALVLENAISQAVASSAATSYFAGNSAFVPADLVLLVNAASDSLRAKGSEEMFDRMGMSVAPPYLDPNRPLVVQVTSTGDGATGAAFPAGTIASNLFQNFRSYDSLGLHKSLPHVSQEYFVTHTPGHNEYLQTHCVDVKTKDIDPSFARRDAPRTMESEQRFWDAFNGNLSEPRPPQMTGPGSPCWTFRSIGKEGVAWSTIKRAGKGLVTPYWIIQVPPEIIHGHDDVFSLQALCLYAALFRIDNPDSKALTQGPRKMLMAEPQVSGSR